MNYRKLALPLALSGVLFGSNAYPEVIEVDGEKIELEETTPTTPVPAPVPSQLPVQPVTAPTTPVAPVKPASNPVKKSKLFHSFFADVEAGYAFGSQHNESKGQSGSAILGSTADGSVSGLNSRFNVGTRLGSKGNEIASLGLEQRSRNYTLDNSIETIGTVGKTTGPESDLVFLAKYDHRFRGKDLDYLLGAGAGFGSFSRNQTTPHDILIIKEATSGSGLAYQVLGSLSTKDRKIIELLYRHSSASGDSKADTSIPSFSLTLPQVSSKYSRDSNLVRLEGFLDLHKWANLSAKGEIESIAEEFDNSGVIDTDNATYADFSAAWHSPELLPNGKYGNVTAGVYAGLRPMLSGSTTTSKKDETQSSLYGGIVLTYHLDTGRVSATLSQNPVVTDITPCYVCRDNKTYVKKVHGKECPPGYQAARPNCAPAQLAPATVTSTVAAQSATRTRTATTQRRRAAAAPRATRSPTGAARPRN